MANPWRLASPFKLPQGSRCSSCACCTQLRRHIALLLEKKQWPLVLRLSNYYFLGDIDLQFMNDFPGARRIETSSMFRAQRWSRFQFWRDNEDYGIATVYLRLSEWTFMKWAVHKRCKLKETYLRVWSSSTSVFCMVWFGLVHLCE